MFKQIFIEKHLAQTQKAQDIIQKFPKAQVQIIDDLGQFWGRVKKPYLQKRDSLNLWLGEKKGQLVKKAPDAYGEKSSEHYYFIHAYNCIYECQYCYLQGYFNTPDLVLFLNHEEIIEQMELTIKGKKESVWFHAGEFSDSLALSHITGELEIYWKFFKENPKHFLELRTKSANIKALCELPPQDNCFASFTLSIEEYSKTIDLKTPSLKARLNAMAKLQKLGHPIAIHLDPIIYHHDFEQSYQDLITKIKAAIDITKVAYFSLGVVRFTKDVYKEFERNYPQSSILQTDMSKSFDGKIRYTRPMRQWMMNKVQQYLLETGVEEKRIYQCMEE